MYKYQKQIYYLTFFIIASIFFINFYIFGRLTVDDAFISFQYGKNLINYGVWNYNPSDHDISQSYSNALYAIISIIPHLFDIDVVLFFKIFSLITIIGSFLFLARVCNWNKLALLSLSILYSMPFTIAHAFSGLETFLFVNFVTFLFIALDKKKFKLSLFLTSIMILIRQESYIFIIIVPIYFYFFNNYQEKLKYYLPLSTFFLAIFFYLSVSFLYFGDFFSTSFYVKSVNVELGNPQLLKTIILCIFSLSLLPVLFIQTNVKENYAVIFVILIFVLILTVVYTSSDLAMNYGKRFYFHIYYPVITFVIYKTYSKHNFVRSYLFRSKSIVNAYILIFCTSLLSYQYFNDLKQQLHIANYYPRLINSHALVGNIINEMSTKKALKSISISDAGIVPYISNMINIDSFGLGNMMVAKKGISVEMLKNYDPSLIFLSRPKTTYTKNKQMVLLKYVKNNSFILNCNLTINFNKSIEVWSKQNFKLPKQSCDKSLINNYNDKDFFSAHISKHPFYFWRSFKNY